MIKFKIIKSKEFSFMRDKVEVKATAYTVAHKGRAINVSTLNFEEGELSVVGEELHVKSEVELIADVYTSDLGEQRRGIKLVPKMDLMISSL